MDSQIILVEQKFLQRKKNNAAAMNRRFDLIFALPDGKVSSVLCTWKDIFSKTQQSTENNRVFSVGHCNPLSPTERENQTLEDSSDGFCMAPDG